MMARPLVGRTIRRLRSERRLTQQTLATQLGISASYLNLIEHDQRTVTASLLIKLGEAFQVDLATLSGRTERQLGVALREAFADPLLSADAVPESEVAELAAAAPNAARSVLALYRACASRARTPAASPCHLAAACCYRTRRRAIFSTNAAIIFQSSRARRKRLLGNCKLRRPI